jgi:hypothetical protein
LKKLYFTGQFLAALQRRLKILQKCCPVDTQESVLHGVERKLEIALKQFQCMGKQIKTRKSWRDILTYYAAFITDRKTQNIPKGNYSALKISNLMIRNKIIFCSFLG